MQIPHISGLPAGLRQVSARLGLGLAGVATMLLPVLHFGRGETATHARLHLTASTVVMVIAAVVALSWRGPYGRFERRSRKALVYALCFLAGSQLAESAGALAWDADGVTVRSRTLHLWHTVATVASATALVTVAFATAIAALVIARRLIVMALSHPQPNMKGTP